MRSAITTPAASRRHVRRGLALLVLVMAALLAGPASTALAEGPVAAVTSATPVAGQAAAPVADTADGVVHHVRAAVPEPVHHVARQSTRQGAAAVAQTQRAAADPAATAAAATRAVPVAPATPAVARESSAGSASGPRTGARPAHHRSRPAAARRSRSHQAARHTADGRTSASHRSAQSAHGARHHTIDGGAPSARELSPGHPSPDAAPTAAGASAGSASGSASAFAPLAALACLALLFLAPRRRGARLRLPSATWTPTVLLLSIERPD